MSKALSWIKGYFTPVEVTSPKTNNFNIVRFVTAFFVIYGHMSAVMGTACPLLFTQRISTIGVKIFFIISGYLITKSYLSDPHPVRYMIRRTFRIFPALLVVVLASVFILGPIMSTLSPSDYFGNPNTWRYLKNLILSPVYALPGVFTDYIYPNAINGSLWTLPVEFTMYLVLPACLLLFKKLRCVKLGLLACTVGTLVLSLLYAQYFPSWRLVVYGSNLVDALPLLPYFFLGSLCSFPQAKKVFNLQGGIALIVLAAVIAPAIVSEALRELIVFLTFPYFILSLSLTDRPIFSKWFAKSDFSYGLYLYGFPIQQITYRLLASKGFSTFEMALICFAITLLFAIFSWYLIEKNAQKLGQKLIKKIGKQTQLKPA